MAFSWLPDATRYPHSRLAWLAESGVELVVISLYKREAILPPDFHIEDGSIIVSNHLRNSDVPILASVLCRRNGLRYPLPFFATRDDIFRSHFLRDFLRGAAWPPALSALIGLVPVRWLLRLLRAQPMRRVREFTLDRALAALRKSGHGDLPPELLLREATLRRIKARCGRVPPTISALARSRRLGPMRWETWGLRRLRLGPCGLSMRRSEPPSMPICAPWWHCSKTGTPFILPRKARCPKPAA